MYNNIYPNTYNPQVTKERIDSQIAQLQTLKEQLGTPQPSINQTFQLAPTHNGIHYVNNIDDVQKEIVYNDTAFFSNDLSVLWLKNAKGDIRAFELTEIVKKDDKDLIIENLQYQINEMKEMIKNAKPTNANVDKSNENEEPASVSNNRTSKKK